MGVCVLVAVLIVGAAAFKPIKDWYDLRAYASDSLGEIGAKASVCQDVTTKKAEGNQDHVDVGTPMTYPDAPPAFGQHWNMWDSMERKLYTASDRPELGELVHNLEHGFTILWYDETIADDSDRWTTCAASPPSSQGTDNLRDKFKAVPWTSEDGKAFPKGQHVALDALVARRRRRDRPGQAGRRLAVLLRGQRLRAGDLHGGLPLHGLPGAHGRLTSPMTHLRRGARGAAAPRARTPAA